MVGGGVKGVWIVAACLRLRLDRVCLKGCCCWEGAGLMIRYCRSRRRPLSLLRLSQRGCGIHTSHPAPVNRMPSRMAARRSQPCAMDWNFC